MTPPNIVVIQADQMAAQALGAYGDAAARTPHMDALAADGAVFEPCVLHHSPVCAVAGIDDDGEAAVGPGLLRQRR